ncbi:MAG: prepilin-type N-terminal cleavage/methylation domain-containing protein [Planctomycetes bacterium]|nr:prepilin-type N-terminal cleavage/methylation domain-containing protein [Planctomycetota bacterium]
MNRNQRRGLTLIELIVVLALIGIVLGLAAPSAISITDVDHLRAASVDISSEIDYVRAMAAFNQQKYGIRYGSEYLSGDRVSFYAQLAPPEVKSEQEMRELRLEAARTGRTELDQLYPTYLDESIRIGSVALSDDERLNPEAEDIDIEVSPLGFTVGHIVYLESVENPGIIFSIEINPVTSFISITEGEKEWESLEDDR